ncbi:MAG: tripartite tricarboxylate transporter substrate binding protein [Burkholderiales bacterium]|nr:tripartite tricarboxylate transporter substrate binding protein [Burkholderiales bacterium]
MNCTAAFVLVLLPLLTSSAAFAAEQYPNRPIRMIVPFNAGGTATVIARAIANGAEPALNQTFVVDNRGGANGIIGTQMVVNAAPDGYTLLQTTTSIAINPSVYKALPYDTLKDLEPVTMIAVGAGYVLLGSLSLGAESVKDLIALAKKPASKVAYGSAGIGNSTHLVAEMFGRAAGVKLTHVAYKGVAPAINAVLGGEVQVMFIPPTIAVSHIKGGKVRALGFTGESRWSFLPDVPTIAESGLPGFSRKGGWHAWFAPKGTPAPILRRLQQAAHAASHNPKISNILITGGYDPLANSPEEARKFLVSEIESYAKIVKAVGIEPQ